MKYFKLKWHTRAGESGERIVPAETAEEAFAIVTGKRAPFTPPYQPVIDDAGNVPQCNEHCSQFDGSRCMLLGYRPGTFCEPAIKDLIKPEELLTLKELLKTRT